MRKGTESEGYNGRQGQSLVCVCVYVIHMLVLYEQMNERAHRWSCDHARESERASFMRLYPFLRTECSSGPAGESSVPCDSSALLFGYGA